MFVKSDADDRCGLVCCSGVGEIEGSGGSAGSGCGIERVPDVRHPLRPQGGVLSYERE